MSKAAISSKICSEIKNICDGHSKEFSFLEEQLHSGLNPNYVLDDYYGYSMLHIACFFNVPEVVRILLAQDGIQIGKTTKYGCTPLHCAAYRGSSDCMKLILDQLRFDINACVGLHQHPDTAAYNTYFLNCIWGFGPNGKDNGMAIGTHERDKGATVHKDGRTALHLAAQGDNVACLEMLLAVDGIDINIRDSTGRTALHRARVINRKTPGLYLAVGSASYNYTARFGDRRNALNLLLDDERTNVNVRDIDGRTALHLAAKSKELPWGYLLQLTIDERVDMNLRDNQGYSALHLAVHADGIDDESMLPDVEYFNNRRRIPQRRYVLNGLDFDAGALLDWIGYKNYAGCLNLRELLLSHRVDVNIRDNHGRTALHEAVRKNKVICVKLLLSDITEGLDVNARDDSGFTALHWAAHTPQAFFYSPLRHLLLDPRVNVNLPDNGGRSALHVAANMNQVKCLEHLLAVSNINVNMCDVDGRTPLHLAANKGHGDCLKLLLKDQRVNEDKCDKDGCTAFDLAAKSAHPECLKLFKKIGPTVPDDPYHSVRCRSGHMHKR